MVVSSAKLTTTVKLQIWKKISKQCGKKPFLKFFDLWCYNFTSFIFYFLGSFNLNNSKNLIFRSHLQRSYRPPWNCKFERRSPSGAGKSLGWWGSHFSAAKTSRGAAKRKGNLVSLPPKTQPTKKGSKTHHSIWKNIFVLGADEYLKRL